MRNIILTGLLLTVLQITNAQISAVTETGDPVILYEDGTWVYLNAEQIENVPIPINEKKFFKGDNSTFLVKSKKLNIGIWIDPKKWSFTRGTENDAFEYQFQKKGDDLYAMLISEKMQIPIETLKRVAVENAMGVAPDIKIVKEEYRLVNGIQVLMLRMEGTIQGMEVTYFGYYYSNSNGTIQLISYTGQNLFSGFKDDIVDFLNGLVEIK